ncbi:MAG: FAD:protein FMN transferase [Clostridia bacterium]|nr:FAD:protein FMN transferase [Clostridia bacterium]
MKKAFSVFLCLLIVLQLCGCTSAGDRQSLTKGDRRKVTETVMAMNTVMQITVFRTSEGTTQQVADLMKKRITELEELFDVNSPDSDVSKINNFEGTEFDDIHVNEDTANILTAAKGAYYGTDYLFDIKIMPVLKLWGFDNGNYGVPKAEDIEKALAVTDKSRINIYPDENTVRLTEGTEISLGGIAKGYLGDELLKIAEEYGATALLSLGGNIVLCGEKSEDELWRVGVKNPKDTENIVCSVECKGNQSVVTSGGYERYFEYGGQEYHHIIDPRTGYPAESDLLSVTVIGENGTMCDAYSTALFIMGKEKAVDFAAKANGYEFIFITESDEILATDGVNIESDGFKFKSIPR